MQNVTKRYGPLDLVTISAIVALIVTRPADDGDFITLCTGPDLPGRPTRLLPGKS